MVVADLGAGVGYFVPETLRRLSPEGRLYVVDPDRSNLELARSRAGEDARSRWIVGSAAGVPEIPSASVDRVLLSLVLCCLVDKEGALDETWRILRPGGRAYVSYPRRSRPTFRRRVSLRVTPERWAGLVRRRPWVVRGDRVGFLIVTHLLEKPPGLSDDSAGLL
jgi:ubiquinone/menaquinone biosynthesis C-methylase UbiE